MEEWVVQSVMALFEGACTEVRTENGNSGSFDVEVWVHQGSVLSPLLFAVFMDMVFKIAQEGLPWELLCADNLLLVAPTREELAGKVAAWQARLLAKGMKVNVAKSKFMVSKEGAG